MIWLCACRQESDVPQPAPQDSFRLHFNITTATPGKSRAHDDTAETSREGSGAENFINVDDILYLIFDSEGNYLCDISPSATTVAADADFTVYDVVAEINDSYFLEHIDDTVDFYLVALANHSGWGIDIPELTRDDSLNTLFESGPVMTILPNASFIQKAPDASADDRMFFPMTGIQRFIFPGNLLRMAQGVTLDLTLATGKSLDLLRALAKIEVIDRIGIGETGIYNSETDADSPLRINSVSLSGIMTEGRLLPSLEKWTTGSPSSVATADVTSPSLPATSPTPYSASSQLQFTSDPYASSLREDKCPVFSCYVYEYSKTAVEQLEEAGSLPELSVTITGGKLGTDENAPVMQPETYTLSLSNYKSGFAETGKEIESLVRNHIYRFEIDAVGRDLQVSWTLCPMRKETTEIIFK